MKNDYLWNKTGNDSEIEKLETALKQFQFQDSALPEISSNVVQFKNTKTFKFPIFRAIAAGFIFAFGLIVFWFIYAGSEQEIVQTFKPDESAKEINLKVENSVENVRKVEKDIYKNSGEIKPEKHFINLKAKSKNQNRNAQKLIYKNEVRKTESKNKTQFVKLSVEEKEAYDNLMLALSITSSKLKIVRDKVQNTDEKTAINK